jgi:hypothetical protein
MEDAMNERHISRRTMMAGGGIAGALFATALGLTLPRWLRRHYAPTAYDDLLNRLVDRDAAARVGQVVRDSVPLLDDKRIARELRQRFEERDLTEVVDADTAEGRISEAGGWIMPESLTELCVLAAG